MESILLAALGSVFTAFITLLLLYVGVQKASSILILVLVVIFTFSYPFLSYLMLIGFKSWIDSFYRMMVGPVKLTHIFSVYSVVVWSAYLYFKRGMRRPIGALDVAHFALLLPVPFIFLFSPNVRGLDLGLRILSGWGFYFLGRELDKEHYVWVERAFILSLIFPTITGILALLGYLPTGFQEGAFLRLKGPYHDATAFAFELVPGFLILLQRLERRFNPLEFIMVIVILVLFYNTYTRSIWVSILLTLMLIVVKRKTSSTLRLIGLGSVIALVVLYPQITERFAQHGVGTDPNSFNGRMMIWREGFGKFFSLHPLAIFFGLITTGKPMGIYLHNVFLMYLIDMGVFGFMVFTMWLITATRFVLTYRGLYSTALRGGMIFAVIGGLTTGSLLYPNFQWFLLSVLGMAMGERISQLNR
ncbi:MAG: O-antigen ligase family protein [Thermotogae bacterium]|nr:O-antigen ligase family protein [Thermotogota bacterium]